jgi:hypothetical protein
MVDKFLYHGSTHKILGKIEPRKCMCDFGDNPDEKLKAVYATDRRGLAIGYAILVCDGVVESGLDDQRKRPPYSIIRIGWPKNFNTKLYIYKLPPKGFKRVRGEEHEYYSLEPVKPVSVETIKLKDYIHYARKSKNWKPSSPH